LHSLAHGCITPVPVTIFRKTISSACLRHSLSLFLGHLCWTYDALGYSGCSHLKTLDLITSAKVCSPNKFKFTGSGVRLWTNSLEDHITKPPYQINWLIGFWTSWYAKPFQMKSVAGHGEVWL
jgi:hypothetical protein